MKAGSHVLDAYVIDTLMADLVGHDRRPSAFLVYLAIISAAGPQGRAGLSHMQLAERTGLSKRAVQDAAKALARRGLVEICYSGATDIRQYRPLSPWRR
jgi:hypothetical protein